MGGSLVSARERAAAKAALAKLLEWHHARPNEVVGAELDFELDLELQAGRARVRGQIDRLERDPEGRGIVIDYKTGRVRSDRPTRRKQSPQLGLYQLAVLNGAVVGPCEPGDPGRRHRIPLQGSAGAALLHLRKGGIRTQEPLGVDADGRTWVHELLEELVTAIASESFPARKQRRLRHLPGPALLPRTSRRRAGRMSPPEPDGYGRGRWSLDDTLGCSARGGPAGR